MGDVFEPPVLYARTSDGVSIAYTAFGNAEGATPLVCLRPPQLSHMALEYRLPMETRWHEFETLSQKRLVVRLDSRSSGLSDRGVEDISLDARCRDIDAVVDKVGIGQFALQAQLHSGSWAVTYAVRNPERVTRLILIQTYTRGEDYWSVPARAALEPLAALDWVTYTEASMSNAFAWAPGELPRALAALMRSAVTQQDFLKFLAEDRKVDVTADLERVECPVLVVHFELNAVTNQNIARRLAASARDGRLLLPKTFREALDSYGQFIDEDAQDSAASPDLGMEDEGLRIFLVASSEAAPGAAERLIEEHGGMAVSSMAGTTTSLFESAQQALRCARALAAELGAGVGIHAGEPGPQPLERADPALVTAVLASGLAGRGGVVVSNLVRELAAGKGFSFELMEFGVPGEDDEEVRLFTLR